MGKYKFFTMLLIAAIVAACIMPMAGPSVVHAAGNVYYVDSSGGDDSNAGTDPGSAWKTLDKVNATTFQPGDTILFKAGGVWTGTLSPKGSGSAGSPIKIDMYGTGNKPLIAGAGAASAVYFYNQEQWELRNLEITNDAATAGVRRGIHLDGSSGTWTNPKVYQHFVFENLDIHNVKGNVGSDYAHNGGIIVWGTAWDYHVSDVTINNCKIYSVDSVGIYLNGAQTKYSTGLKVTNNLIYDVAADGAFVLNTTNGLIENNIVHDTHVRASGYHVPLWVFSAKNNVIQFNEVYNTAAGGDAMAFDADYNSDGTIIQYNYSHNNAGGGFLVVNDGTKTSNFNTNAVIRYNISQNDSGAVFNFNGTPDTTYVYNNTVYLPRTSQAKVINHSNWGGYAKNTYFYNNLIYNLGSGGYTFASSTNNVFENNLFYGNHPANEPADPYKITADPQLASPGSGGIGQDTLIGYNLLNTSPAIGAGKVMANNGGRDYYGNPVSATAAPNIGAYGGPGLDPNNLPPLPQPPTEENLLKNPGFETGEFTNWPIHYNGASITADGNAHTGTYTAKVTGSAAGVEQTVVSLYPNTIYKLYAWGKSVGGGDAVLGVKNYGGNAIDVHFNGTSYTRKEITFTTGSSNTSAIIYLYKGGGSGDVYFDDVELFQFSSSPGGDGGPVFTVGTDDEFDSAELNSQWHWIRENSANWSLTAKPGSMRIAGEAGDIVDGQTTAKNILITGAPDGDWMIETRMEGKPTSRWSQGGLIVYVDDTTWFRMTRLYGSGNQIQFTKQIDLVRSSAEESDPIDSPVIYLRIIKYGNTYSGYYSADGVTYTQLWSTQQAALANPKIGLIVAGGTGLTADFDYFHVITDGIVPPPPPAPVPVSGVALDKTSLSLRAGKTAVLKASITPSYADNKQVTWSSDNPAVAAVDNSGKVTAVSKGTATITATTVDGGKTANCAVEVTEFPPGILFMDDLEGETVGKAASEWTVGSGSWIVADDGGNKAYRQTNNTNSGAYSTVNLSADNLSYEARFKANNLGGSTSEIWLGLRWTDNNNMIQAGYNAAGNRWEIRQKANGAYTSLASVPAALNIGQWYSLKVTAWEGKIALYVNGAETPTLSTSLATVKQAGRIAVYAGKADVLFDDFVMRQGQKPAPILVTGVTVAPSSVRMRVGESASLTATVEPFDADNKQVTWSTSNAAAATVNVYGTVTAVGPGTAVITATTVDGSKIASSSVAVTPLPSGVIFSDFFTNETVGSNASKWKVLSGSWQVADDNGNYVYQQKVNTNFGASSTVNMKIADYTYEAKFKANSFNGSAGEIWLLLRYTDNSQYIRVGYNHASDQWEIRERVNAVNTILATAPAALKVGQWYSLKVVASGPNIALYVNGSRTPTLSTSSATKLNKSSIGVLAGRVDAEFDDILIWDGVQQDTTPPELTAPADKTVEAAGARTGVEIGGASATDESDVTIANDAPAGFPLGTTIVTWTATDIYGNSRSAVQKITVIDTTPPTLTAPADVTVTATAKLTPVTLGEATATDLVDGPVTVTNDAPIAYPVGSTIVTFTAKDSSGNVATARMTVIVRNTPPVLDPIGDQTVNEGKTLEIVIHAADPNEDTVTYSVYGLPAGAVFDPAAAKFTWTPGYSQAGSYTVAFKASDGELTDGKNVAITVRNVTASDLMSEVAESVSRNLETSVKAELLAKLGNAMDSWNRGNKRAVSGMLHAFANSVEAQRGKKINDGQADAWLQSVATIESVMSLE
ncbi:Ig-like domain-containing protein [Paenibacillus sp. HJGM_3]|uniref:Ig-like domain-containing protein n=1 Tax=Paenibacillus sp. HJGM_3 TaxID=3379816 RepID=UPI00385E5F59